MSDGALYTNVYTRCKVTAKFIKNEICIVYFKIFTCVFSDIYTTFANMNEKYLDTDLNDKRIAVLLSGGADSSVVVYELEQRELHPDCFYIKIGP